MISFSNIFSFNIVHFFPNLNFVINKSFVKSLRPVFICSGLSKSTIPLFLNLWRGGGGDSGCCQGKYVLSCDYGNIATHSLGKIIQIDYCGFKPGFYSKFELLPNCITQDIKYCKYCCYALQVIITFRVWYGECLVLCCTYITLYSATLFQRLVGKGF